MHFLLLLLLLLLIQLQPLALMYLFISLLCARTRWGYKHSIHIYLSFFLSLAAHGLHWLKRSIVLFSWYVVMVYKMLDTHRVKYSIYLLFMSMYLLRERIFFSSFSYKIESKWYGTRMPPPPPISPSIHDNIKTVHRMYRA